MTDRLTKHADAMLGSLAAASAAQMSEPETPAQKRQREDGEFMESIRIRNDAPKITTADYLAPKGRWKDVRILAAELAEAERKAEEDRLREMECPTLREIPAPEF